MCLEKPGELSDVIFFILFHLLPKCLALGVSLRVFDIVLLDAPQTFLLLYKLFHQIVCVIVVHIFSI